MIWWPGSNLSRLLASRVAGGLAASSVSRCLSYLHRYGYLPRSDESDPDAVAAAAKAFRERFGLLEGDTLDSQVERAMSWPRCGVSDHLSINFEEARWRKTKLTYFVESYVGGLSKQDQDELLTLAWQDWMAVCGIVVTRAASKATADIVISTGRGRGQNFDGPSGTLAWAYLPNGQDTQLLMRFDLDETWIRDATKRGILFRHVACHEMGHLLGLDHSKEPSALMAAYYSATIGMPQQKDDIPRSQGLYGPPVSTPETPAPTKPEIILRFDGPIPDFTCSVKK